MDDTAIHRIESPDRPAAVTLRIDRTQVKNALRPQNVRAVNQHLLAALVRAAGRPQFVAMAAW